jgi:hypothetical protein
MNRYPYVLCEPWHPGVLVAMFFLQASTQLFKLFYIFQKGLCSFIKIFN